MKVRLLLLFFTSAMLLPLLLSHAQTQAPRGQTVRIKVENGKELELYRESYALVIGASAYGKGWPNLPGATRDVTAVEAALKSHGFTVETLTNPTRAQFDKAVRSFIRTKAQAADNRVLIYFAGHGHTLNTIDGRSLGYLVPVDAPDPNKDPGAFKEVAISMDEIEVYARQIEAKHALFMFDSCFSGSLFEPNRAVPPAIAERTARPVRQFITAGTAEQTVPDNSLFRAQFIEALQGEADLNNDGYVTGSELGLFLEDKVTNYSNRAQTPRWGKIRNPNLDKGDFVFALPKKETPAAAVTTHTPVFDPAAVELALWTSAQRNDDIGDYEEYLRQYPQGRFAVSARNRITKLKAPAAVVTPPVTNPVPAERTSVTGVPLRAFTFETVTTDGKGAVKARRQVEGYGYTESINGVALELVKVLGGTFTMGSPANEANRESDEVQHEVTVSSFMMGKYEVTQAQWAVVAKLPKVKIDLPADPARFKGASLPVEQVSWEEAVEFCARLSLLTNRSYRLPTEAEWEYAARAGTQTPFSFGDTVTTALVNYDGNYPYEGAYKGEYRRTTIPVGSLNAANAFGLYDLHGNVWEWCQDWYGAYGEGSQTNPSSPISGERRVVRGGSWNYNGYYSRSAYRLRLIPDYRDSNYGFRVVTATITQ